MAEAGLKSVEVAKANGTWDGAYTDRIAESLPEEFASLLSLNKHASQNFICFPTSSRNMYVRWIRQAKTATTRQSRINTVIKRSEKNLQPGEIE
ncbi:YdeI/OmpD-associated family protein [Dehalogenimonas sp. 4OHTPN]|uniref:YdeI/OmpD-associated family protein n=1 Tax=Dehalogenimonas sp. 4OHTPN TaxID=3166643 RepID=A0AAU8GCN4_9CHLR